MGLSELVAEIRADLAGLAGVEDAPADLRNQLVAERTLLVYAIPGDSVAQQHAGRAGRIVVLHSDTVIVEWHLLIAADQLSLGDAEGKPMVDRLRRAIWGGFAADRFGGAVTGLMTVATTQYGDMGWAADYSFGCRLSLAVTHLEEITA